MTDLVSFGIIGVAVTLWGLFMIRRARAESRLLVDCSGAGQQANIAARAAGSWDFVLFKPSNLPVVPTMHPSQEAGSVLSIANRGMGSASDAAGRGIEYHFHSKLGTLTIASIPGLPSAVELRVAGKALGTFISAEFAANAVAEGQANHNELNGLAASERPQKLSDWEKSFSHHFRI